MYSQNDAQTQQLTAAFHGDRSGYTESRHSPQHHDTCCHSSPSPAESPATVADDGAAHGVDDVETEIQPGLALPSDAKSPTPTDILKSGGSLVSTSARTTPFNDYDPRFLLFVHPLSFPHGVGARPKGMTMKYWVKLLLERHNQQGFAQ